MRARSAASVRPPTSKRRSSSDRNRAASASLTRSRSIPCGVRLLCTKPNQRLQHRRPIGVQEHRLGHGVSQFADGLQIGGDPGRHRLLDRQQWIVLAHRPARRADRFRQRLYRLHHGVLVGEHGKAQTVGMCCAQRLGRGFGHRHAHGRRGESPVESTVDFAIRGLPRRIAGRPRHRCRPAPGCGPACAPRDGTGTCPGSGRDCGCFRRPR